MANNSSEQTKKDMAKVYGIKLTDIEEVILPNGKEYFKFCNPEDKTIRMIENRNDSANLSEQFKRVQATLDASQSENERQNAKAVFDYQLKYQNVELSLIPVSELKGNRGAYKHLFDRLEPNKKKAIRVLLENMDYLELTYINLENGLAIDKDNHVIVASYDPLTEKCQLTAAEVRNYETNKTAVHDESYTFDLDDSEIDMLVEYIDIESDIPTIKDAYEIEGKQETSQQSVSKQTVPTIRGREVNLNFAIQAYNYPEIIERSELSGFDKMLYRAIIRAISRKKEKLMVMTKQKQYVMTPKKPTHNQQAAFVDSILLALLLGFFSGLLLTLVYISIKAGI